MRKNMSVVFVGFAHDHASSFYYLETNPPDKEIKKIGEMHTILTVRPGCPYLAPFLRYLLESWPENLNIE